MPSHIEPWADLRSAYETESIYIIPQIYYLSLIELLKEINFDELDIDLAKQYGKVYDTPWKECDKLTQVFMQNHKDVLYGYVVRKCLEALKDCYTFISTIYKLDLKSYIALSNKNKCENDVKDYSFAREYYRFLPMTAAALDQIDAVLDTCKLCKVSNKVHGKIVNDKYIGNLKLVSSQLESIDMMTILNFNNYGNKNIILTHEGNYLRPDQVLQIFEFIDTMLNNELNTSFKLMSRDLHFDTIRAMTYFASILLHTFHPDKMRPKSFDDLYKNKIVQITYNNYYNTAVSYARGLTNKNLAYVLNLPLDTALETPNRNHPEKRNIVRPYSLQEMYLVLYFMMNMLNQLDIGNTHFVN